ncbi:DNA polymerase III subunit beta [Luteibaculum oceani]|uniref:Beta sliding clamp n=1 Tax=Luteibaculum oceani TaxID=1294296 RepID=A0A5C6V9V4_9FLAO|nr:DNA polymerase III subunit beta [Luteibaculum oceani]TXC81967.1 DNA polymerase III subunit beta [Luteibaculum oceani]
MNFVISSSKLLKQLVQLNGVINSSNTLPILDNFYFEIKKDEIIISASDLETTVSSKVEAKSESEGKVCIPAKMLVDALKSFPDQPLSFSVNPDDFGVEISSDLGKYKLNGYNGEEFPKTPVIEAASSVKISSDILARAINKTLFATGNDDLRPIMSGIYFDFTEEGLTFVATDAHKLVRYKRADAKAEGASNFVVPKKPLNLLKSILASSAEDVTITYNENNAHFNLGDATVICRLIDGNYPNYEAVIPKENPNKLTISRTALQNSIKRVSIFANKTTHQVRLKISGNELSIFAEDLDFSNEAQEKLSCQYTGEDMEIGFNSRFLNEMLNNLDADDVIIELSAPSRAGILLPVSKDIEEEDILMLVMPVMLNN